MVSIRRVPEGAQFSKQALEARVTVPVMGGDGLKDPAYISSAGPASDGDLASSVGAAIGSLGWAEPFLAAYGKKGSPNHRGASGSMPTTPPI